MDKNLGADDIIARRETADSPGLYCRAAGKHSLSTFAVMAC